MHHTSMNPLAQSAQPHIGAAATLPSTSANELPAEILFAANHNWKVFPILTQSRHASFATSLIAQATSDIDPLTRWAAEYAGCNWAVATGAASGVFVLVFDGLSAQRAWLHSVPNGEDEDYRIEQTLTVLAGRGESAQRSAFFRWPARRRQRTVRIHRATSAVRVPPGAQLHAEDDFVLIPPSTDRNAIACIYLNPEASVQPAPQWLIDLAFEPEDGDG